MLTLVLAATLGAPSTVLVLDLRLVGEAPPGVAALGPEIAELIARSPETKVMTQEDLRTLLQHTQDLQATGCSADEACIAEVARAARSDRVVTGTIGTVGSSLILSLSL